MSNYVYNLQSNNVHDNNSGLIYSLDIPHIINDDVILFKIKTLKRGYAKLIICNCTKKFIIDKINNCDKDKLKIILDFIQKNNI